MPITGPIIGLRSMLEMTVVLEFVMSPRPATMEATMRRQT
jgi:hypothetical protein